MIRLELVGDDSCTIQDQGTTTDSTRRLRDGHEDDQTAPPRRHSQQQQQQHVLLMSSMLKSEGADSTDADGSSSSLALSPNNNAVVSDSGMTGPLSATDAADPTARIRQTIVSFTSPPFFVSMESDGAAALSHESIVGPHAAGKRYLAQPRPSITDDLLIPTLTPQDGTTATMPTRLRALSSTCGSSPGLSWRLPQALRPAAADNDGENGTSPSPALRSVRSGFGRFFSFNSTSGTTQLLPPHALQSMRQHRLASLASLGGSFNPSAMNVGGDEGRYHGSPNAPTMREGLPLLATGFSSSTEESLSGTPAGPCGAGDAPTPPGVGVVVPGVLYVGSYRAFCDPIACHVLDIQAYLSVAAEVKPGLPPHVAMEDVEAGRVGFCKLQLLDNATTVLKEHLGAVFDFIDEQTQMGRPVALYCQAGKSRSVALAVAVVMREYGLPADGAFHLLKQRYPLAEPNVFFLDQLQNLCRDELHGGPA